MYVLAPSYNNRMTLFDEYMNTAYPRLGKRFFSDNDNPVDQTTKRMGSMIPMARIGKRNDNNNPDSDYYDYDFLPMARIGRGGPGSGMIPMARIGKRFDKNYHIPMPRIG